jgi:hypothetical protein
MLVSLFCRTVFKWNYLWLIMVKILCLNCSS